jgi:hypothetical protein
VFGWFRIGFCVRGARVSVGVSGRDVEKQVTRRVGEWIDGRGRRGGGAVWRGCWRVAGKGEGEVSGRLRGHDAFGQKSWVVSDQRDPAAVDVPQCPTARLIPPTTPPPPSKTPAAATPSTIGRLACTCTLVASTLIRNLLQFRRRGRAGLGLTTPSLLLVVSIVLSALSGAMATCPTYTSWIRPDGWDGIHP